MSQYMEGLNAEQRAAVMAGDGPVLVIAGAGSGKTRVLTSRAAYLIGEKDVSPRNIMALTFTNKAAHEMENRLSSLLEENIYGMWVGTFHRICLRILRREGEVIGIRSGFVIYDDADQRSLVKSIIKQLDLEETVTPAAALRMISDAKSDMCDPGAYAETAFTAEEEAVAEIFKRYEEQKKANNALDFDDLLLYTVELFSTEYEILEEYRARFPRILVDEYQDTNEAQYRLLKLLSGKNGSLFVVGDPDQSIYAFRGARIENILNFRRDYPGAEVFRLQTNYRSTKQILSVANNLIVHNSGRFKKDLVTEKSGKRVEAVLVSDERDEAIYVAKSARQLADEYGYSGIAVFYRTHAQSRAIEEKLKMLRIPYRIFGGLKFFDRKEIKDTVAYLQILVNPEDNVSLLRVINEPRRGIGKTTLDRLEEYSAEHAVPIWTVLNGGLDDAGFKAAAQKKLTLFADLIRGLMDYSQSHTVTETAVEVWNRTGYREQLEKEDTVENISRLENMEEFLTVTNDYDKSSRFSQTDDFEGEINENAGTLTGFLSSVSLTSDLDSMDEDTDDYVTLMTIHMAKGLEFPVVFLVGMEEGVFPHIRSLLSGSSLEIEEERRLCYVGLTRAMEVLKIVRAYRRTLWGRTSYNKPSRFLEEMNIHVPEKSSPAESHGYHAGPEYSRGIAAADVDSNEFHVGDRVLHCKFGEGMIVALDAEEGRVRIAFPDLGIKEFLLAYANLKKL